MGIVFGALKYVLYVSKCLFSCFFIWIHLYIKFML